MCDASMMMTFWTITLFWLGVALNWVHLFGLGDSPVTCHSYPFLGVAPLPWCISMILGALGYYNYSRHLILLHIGFLVCAVLCLAAATATLFLFCTNEGALKAFEDYGTDLIKSKNIASSGGARSIDSWDRFQYAHKCCGTSEFDFQDAYDELAAAGEINPIQTNGTYAALEVAPLACCRTLFYDSWDEFKHGFQHQQELITGQKLSKPLDKPNEQIVECYNANGPMGRLFWEKKCDKDIAFFFADGMFFLLRIPAPALAIIGFIVLWFSICYMPDIYQFSSPPELLNGHERWRARHYLDNPRFKQF